MDPRSPHVAHAVLTRNMDVRSRPASTGCSDGVAVPSTTGLVATTLVPVPVPVLMLTLERGSFPGTRGSVWEGGRMGVAGPAEEGAVGK